MSSVAITKGPEVARFDPSRAGRPRGFATVAVEILVGGTALNPIDDAVLRAIHEFDPYVIPITKRKVYRAPTGEVRVLERHAIASALPAGERTTPVDRRLFESARMPDHPHRCPHCIAAGVVGMRPTHLDFDLEHKDRPGNGLPGSFFPFDWRVYRILRSAYDKWTARERQAYIEQYGEAAQRRKARETAEAEAAYVARQDAPWLKRQVEAFDVDDWKRIRAGVPAPVPTRPSVSVPAAKETS